LHRRRSTIKLQSHREEIDMRCAFTVLTAIAILVILSLACSRDESGHTDSVAEPDAPAAGEPGAAPLPAGNAGHDYVCADGLTFNARIDKGNAVLTLEGKTLTLAPVEGASGAYYTAEDVTFVAMGPEAMLARAAGALQTCKAK
jgi:hypothetical protein